VETFISGGGLEKLYENRFCKRVPFSEVVNDFRNQREPAVTFMQAFFTNFGRALGNLINILDPDIVVLGGGLSNIDEIYTEGVNEVAQYVFSDSFATPIVKNQLGDSAGVIGAALIGC
jgi:fructokinase